jgi:hypothetical protein
LKLYSIDIESDYAKENILVVAENEKQAREKVKKLYWTCNMGIWVNEISEVDGYKIIVKE